MSKDAVENPANESLAKALVAQYSGPTVWEYYVKESREALLIDGQTSSYWRKHFDVKFPTTSDAIKPSEIRALSIKVATLLQEVNDKIRVASITLKMMEETYHQEIAKDIKEQLDKYKQEHPKERKPPKELLETNARKAKAPIVNAVDTGRATIQFFSEIEKTLDKMLRVVDQINVSNAHDVKAERNIPRIQ